MKLRIWGACYALTLALLFFAASTASAQSGASEDVAERQMSPDEALRAASIARQTMSPFCPGRTLADCPSNYATEWRRDIRSMVASGLTAEQIQRELSKRAGGDLSGIPHREASYALPLAIGAGALVLIVVVFMRLRGRKHVEADAGQETKAPEKPPVESVDDERLEAELDAEDDD